jgi:hypothetical protein
LSAQDTLLLEVTADNETSNLIENAFQNAAIYHIVESRTPLRIRVGAYHATLALLIAVLEENVSTMKGKVSFPDGTVFEITPDGLKALRQFWMSKLKSVPVYNPPNSNPQDQTNILDVFKEAMKNPEGTGKLVKEIAGALRGDPEVALEETKQVSRFTLAIMVLMGLVIVSASVLAYIGRIDGTAVGLIYGTVIGSSFAFLYKYLDFPDNSSS